MNSIRFSAQNSNFNCRKSPTPVYTRASIPDWTTYTAQNCYLLSFWHFTSDILFLQFRTHRQAADIWERVFNRDSSSYPSLFYTLGNKLFPIRWTRRRLSRSTLFPSFCFFLFQRYDSERRTAQIIFNYRPSPESGYTSDTCEQSS